MNDWLDDFTLAIGFLTRLPMPHPDSALPTISPARTACSRWWARLIGLAIGLGRLACWQPACPIWPRRRSRSAQARFDRRAARGWPRRCRRRLWRRSRRAKACDHARQPARHLRRDRPAGELCGKVSALATTSRWPCLPGLIVAHALARGVLPALPREPAVRARRRARAPMRAGRTPRRRRSLAALR